MLHAGTPNRSLGAGPKFERQVLEWVQSTGLLCQADRVLVAVSGGPDSVALLSLCVAWQSCLNLSLWVLHVNHGLRETEGREDAAFVESVCRRLGVPYRQKNLALKAKLYKGCGQSLQAVAREQRYRVFTEEAQLVGANKIALGHTQDDQAETVVMWMLRGAGSPGLSGMPAFRPPSFIRPLLQSSRHDILKYLDDRHLDYRMDSSNQNRGYLRNRLRLDVMPVLKAINPNLTTGLSRQADILREESRFLDQAALSALPRLIQYEGEADMRLDRRRLLDLPLALQRRIWLIVLERVGRLPYRPKFEWVDSVIHGMACGQSGGRIHVGPLVITREYEVIHICQRGRDDRSADPMPQLPESMPFPIPSAVRWPLTGQVLEGRLVQKESCSMSGNPRSVSFDTSRFSMPLVIRSWKSGDWFAPIGLQGKRKKLQDFFSDLKVPRAARHRVPIVEAPEGILWIGGYRADHRFCVQESSREVLCIHISQED